MLASHRQAISAGRLLSNDSTRARSKYECLHGVACDHGAAELWSPFREAALARLFLKVRSEYDPGTPEREAIDELLGEEFTGRLDALRRFLRRNPEWLAAQIAAAGKATARPPNDVPGH